MNGIFSANSMHAMLTAYIHEVKVHFSGIPIHVYNVQISMDSFHCLDSALDTIYQTECIIIAS